MADRAGPLRRKVIVLQRRELRLHRWAMIQAFHVVQEWQLLSTSSGHGMGTIFAVKGWRPATTMDWCVVVKLPNDHRSTIKVKVG